MDVPALTAALHSRCGVRSCVDIKISERTVFLDTAEILVRSESELERFACLKTRYIEARIRIACECLYRHPLFAVILVKNVTVSRYVLVPL